MVDLSIAMLVYWRVNGGFSSKACLMTPKDIGYVELRRPCRDVSESKSSRCLAENLEPSPINLKKKRI